MRLILTRHGETVENKKNICQGHLPGTLSDLGIEQAKKLANRLKNEHFDFIFSSDLARAADTAKEIAKYHPETSLLFDEQLRERYFGKVQGKKFSKSNQMFSQDNNAESIESLVKRTGRFLKELKEKYPDKSILIVGHGGTAAALLANILNKSFKKIAEMEHLENTSITIFDPVPEMKLFNCVKHLVDSQ
ncbi:histidine phosphatase family protein [Candidatus Woesearchaeota archaeon]|nr:histidine phosphatase family protein [Candidatus Woesearchaeota archaeon]